MAHLRIQLLGGFHLFWKNERLSTISAPRTQSLLAYLLLHSDVPHARRGLAFRIWPDSTEKQAQTNLRRQLHFLRNGLPEEDIFLAIDHETVGWRTDAPYSLDVADFRRCLADAEHNELSVDDSTAVDALEQAIACYRGDLLPDFYEDWLLTIRETLRQQFVDALDRLMRAVGTAGDYGKSIAYGQRLLQVDPLREETYRRLMEVHLQAGERAKALAAYHECASVLARELGVAASAATTQVYEQVLAQEITSSRRQPPSVSSMEVVTSAHDTFQPVETSSGVDEEVVEPTPLQPSSPMSLVGRQAEWQRLLNVWQRTTQGQAHLVVIQGEAGVGKSRLAEELAAWIRYRDLDLAVTRSYAAAGDLAYTPVIDWLRRPRIQRRLEQLSPDWLAEAARLMPELRRDWPDLPTPPPLMENWQRRRLFEALARGFTTDPRPLLLILDDLQWCDAESLTWIEFFLHYCVQAPVLVVGTLRPEEMEDNPGLAPLLHRLQQADLLTIIELERLDRSATYALAQQIRDGSLDSHELKQLYVYTQGNPLFVVETLRSNMDFAEVNPTLGDISDVQSNIQGLRAALPDKVFAVLQSRLASLSADSRTLAQQMAVFGRACTVPLLAAATGTDEDGLVTSLDELWQRRIIREYGNSETDFVYDFSHDRIRDVSYMELSTVMRRMFHRRAASALEKVYADTVQVVSAQLAHHHALAGQLASAKRYYGMAAEWAVGHYAHEDALRLVTQGLALCQEDLSGQYEFHALRERIYHVQAAREQQQQELERLAQVAAELDDDVRRGETAIREAEYALGAGQYVLAAEAAERAIAVGQRAQSARLEAEGLVQRGMVCWNQGNYPAAGIFYARALKIAREEKAAAMEAKILQHMGALQAYCGTTVYAQQISRQALEAAQRIQDREGEIWALNQLAFGIVEQGDGDYDQAMAHYEQALTLARKSGYRAYEVKILSNTSTLHTRRGNYGAAIACLDQSLAIAQETGSRRHRAFALYHLGVVYSEQADYRAAQEYFAEGLHLFRTIGYRQGEGKSLSDRSWTQIMMGNSSQALADADEALDIAQAIHLQRDQAYAQTRRGYALERLKRYSEAEQAYQIASDLFAHTEQKRRGFEPLAGLVRLALAENNVEKAYQLANPILVCLQESTLDATTEAHWVYETCRRVLRAVNDPAAEALTGHMQHILEARAATIDDSDLRRKFHSVQVQFRVWNAIGTHVMG